MNRIAIVLGIALLVVLGGCAELAPTQSRTTTSSSVTTDTTSRTTIVGTTATTDGTITTADQPSKGTQEVSVTRLENQSRHTEWPDNETVAFENLSKRRQTVFQTALENGSVTFAPDETNPFSFHNKSRPKVVRYDGTWYYVRVAIV